MLLALVFPIADLLSGKPLLHIDSPYHLYQIELGRALLGQGLLIGYDPFFGAGYLGGVGFNPSSKFPLLLSLFVPDRVSTEALYAAYVFAFGLVAPAGIVVACRLLEWPKPHTIIAAILGQLFWWIGGLHWYFTAGMVSYVCGAYLGVAYAAWVWVLSTEKAGRTPARAVLAGLAGGLGMWLHPLFGLVPAILFAGFLVADPRQLSYRMLAVAAGIASIALLSNLPWLLGMREAHSDLGMQPYQREVGLGVLLKPLLGTGGSPAGSLLNPLSAAVSLAGLYFLDASCRRKLLPWLAAGWLLLLFGAFGAALKPLAALQPNRFVASGFLALGVAAAFALGQLYARWAADGNRLRKLGGALAALAVAAVPARELVREVLPGDHGHYGKPPPWISPVPPVVTWLESQIAANTTAQGRILFETSPGRVHGGGHMAGYLAMKTKREFIGSPYPFSLPDCSFWDRFGFGEKIDSLSPDRLARGLELFNVGWIVAHSEGLLRLLGKADQVEPVAESGGIHLFRVKRGLSYVQSGAGRIESRGFNRLAVGGARGPELVLRYRWVPGLATDPPAQVAPEQPFPDFPPLVKIVNPPERFELRYRP